MPHQIAHLVAAVLTFIAAVLACLRVAGHPTAHERHLASLVGTSNLVARAGAQVQAQGRNRPRPGTRTDVVTARRLEAVDELLFETFLRERALGQRSAQLCDRHPPRGVRRLVLVGSVRATDPYLRNKIFERPGAHGVAGFLAVCGAVLSPLERAVEARFSKAVTLRAARVGLVQNLLAYGAHDVVVDAALHKATIDDAHGWWGSFHAG